MAPDGTPDRRTLLAPTDLTLFGAEDERVVTVIGANGSGKSTLLSLVNGLTAPTTGSVTVGGLDTVRAGREVRRRVGFVFTDPAAQLVMPTVVEDVELSLGRPHPGRSRGARATRRTRALEVLAGLGIADLAERSVHELSGGQRQLVALASVLALDPDVLVLDEPTTLLDLHNTLLLRRTLEDLVRRRGLRVLLTTHDLEVAAAADRTILVDDAQVVLDGDPAAAIETYRARIAARHAGFADGAAPAEQEGAAER
ncbi:energy-coupling factor ABC transporter ATP-binding protein [Brevibacterium litoralis]|uniref:energy-coupling factor ABC transporter ATP-binding protein n=1 Tax=Brevibacterium litoralis TaxID=3138935 RepID=UPI003D9A2528